MQHIGGHMPNLILCMISENATPQPFTGNHCVELFLQWLESLIEGEMRYITALVHNFEGYNSNFIVRG